MNVVSKTWLLHVLKPLQHVHIHRIIRSLYSYIFTYSYPYTYNHSDMNTFCKSTGTKKILATVSSGGEKSNYGLRWLELREWGIKFSWHKWWRSGVTFLAHKLLRFSDKIEVFFAMLFYFLKIIYFLVGKGNWGATTDFSLIEYLTTWHTRARWK
jgi:hypothetical protein